MVLVSSIRLLLCSLGLVLIWVILIIYTILLKTFSRLFFLLLYFIVTFTLVVFILVLLDELDHFLSATDFVNEPLDLDQLLHYMVMDRLLSLEFLMVRIQL